MKPKKIAITRVADLLRRGVSFEAIMADFIRINREVWGEITESEYIWTEEMLRSQFRVCPELLYCAFENGVMVATASGFFMDECDLDAPRSWLEITSNGFFTNHRPDGNVAFGADLSVIRGASPKVSTRLMLALLGCGVIAGGIKSLYLGSRIPSYHKHQEMPVEEYVLGKRRNGKPLDPELYFYLRDGFKIVRIIPEYMDDPESLNYGVLVRWDNPLYKATKWFPFAKPVLSFACRKLFLRT